MQIAEHKENEQLNAQMVSQIRGKSVTTPRTEKAEHKKTRKPKTMLN